MLWISDNGTPIRIEVLQVEVDIDFHFFKSALHYWRYVSGCLGARAAATAAAASVASVCVASYSRL